ncbi:MAG: response regulator transcription factor [Betaproteobacteria bacterium]|nr:response regulator transcription factor [Betaproteobacteria bacterium]
MAIRVLIADDHGVVAEGLRFVVEAQADMEVIACIQDSREAVRRSLEMNPDVVLMDHAMPLLNGAEATHLIRERCPETHVIILSMYSDQVHVVRALQAGATGYVVKKSAAKEVVDAIRTVHRGGRYLSKELADSVIDQVVHKAALEDRLERLSSRERQVLQMLAEGHAVPDIATTLSLSPKTVETYRARMMEKLDIHDLATLVKFAIQHGITTLE